MVSMDPTVASPSLLGDVTLRATKSNPWLRAAPALTQASEPAVGPSVELTGPAAPHGYVPLPDQGRGLPVRSAARTGDHLWVVGVHGGSGESTLAELLPGSRCSDHAWPEITGTSPPVLLVARTSVYGLERARIAATQWAASATPTVRLLGLVTIADAPGRLPPPLHDLVKLTRGAVPRTWHVPWIEALRLGVEAAAISQPRSLRRVLSDVSYLTSSSALEGALHV